LFQPEDSLAPPDPAFSEPWQAQVLALADALVRAGCFSSAQWSERLGAELEAAKIREAPDTQETYYLAVLAALEDLMDRETAVSVKDLAVRKEAWTEAYLSTPHGEPVQLRDDVAAVSD